MSDVRKLTDYSEFRLESRAQRLRRGVGSIMGRPLDATGIVLCLLLIGVAILAPYLATSGPTTIDPAVRLQGPSGAHLFGTDELGRDMFSRIIYGARISLTSAAGILGIALALGVPLGLVAGYAGGWWDEAIMRLTDIFLAFPPLILAMAVAASLGPSLRNGVIALGFVWWPWYARLVRGEVLHLKQETYIDAARAMGAGRLRLMFVHLLRNSVAPVIVQMSLDFGYAILILASLSFIGLGAQAPTPEWGAMISDGRQYYLTQWWYEVFPGAAICITVLAFNLLGDAFQSVLGEEGQR